MSTQSRTDPKLPDPKRQKFKVFIGGLPQRITEHELRDHFNQIGPIKSLEIIKDVNTLEPRGFAFIIFDSNETYQKAIKNSQYIKGRRVECKPALSKQKAKVKACDEKGKKLFVGGLSLETTEENLVEYFKAFGEIYKTYLIYDKHKNVSRGFGFVEFKSFESSEKVTNQNEHYLDDKLIECKKILHKAEIDELRSKNPNKKKVHPCAGSDYAGLGSNGPGKSSNKTGDGTANTSPVFEQTSSGAGSQDVPQVDFSTSTNSGDLKKNSSTADPAEKFTGPENPDPNSRAYNKNYLGYPDQVAGGNSLEGWDTGSYQWEADLQPQHQQYYQEHEDFYYNGFMSTEHSNSSSNYNSNSGSNYNYNSQMQQGQRGNGGFTSGLQYQNPLVNHANNAPQGLHGQQFYKPQFENHNLNVHGMQYSNMNTQDRNPMNAPNPQTFSTQHQFSQRQFGGTPDFRATPENSHQSQNALNFSNYGHAQGRYPPGNIQNPASLSPNGHDYYYPEKFCYQKNPYTQMRPQTYPIPNRISSCGMVGENVYADGYGSFCPETQPGISGFFRRSPEDILQRKCQTLPFDMVGEQSILQKLFTEKLLIDDESPKELNKQNSIDRNEKVGPDGSENGREGGGFFYGKMENGCRNLRD